jgi:nucleotide-binding universal stress UspA family protein
MTEPSETADPAPVVVAVGGSDVSASATSWGAAEAERRRLPLRLVHVVGWPYVGLGNSPALEPRSAALEMSQTVLAEAAAQARRDALGLKALSETLWGPVGPMLLDESARAHTLVLGRGARTGYGNALTGSVVPALAAHADCIVVAVPDTSRSDWLTSPPRIVVAFDGSASSHAALAYAKDAGSRRAANIEVLHVESRSAFDPPPATRREPEALSGMEVRTVRAEPIGALVAAAATADLLVVGCRGQALEDPLGSVGRGVIFHARCPVAIVPRPPA